MSRSYLVPQLQAEATGDDCRNDAAAPRHDSGVQLRLDCPRQQYDTDALAYSLCTGKTGDICPFAFTGHCHPHNVSVARLLLDRQALLRQSRFWGRRPRQ